MFPWKISFLICWSSITKNYFIHKITLSKYLIHNHPHIPTHSPVTVYIDAPIIGEEVSHETESLVDHRDEAIGSLPPGITIGELLQYSRRLRELFISDLDLHREVCSHIEWWIDIDELDPSVCLDLLPEWSVFQTREYELVISPDELVRPA